MQNLRQKKPTIAFLPLALDYKLPDEQKLIDYCKNHHLPTQSTQDGGPAWEITPICGNFDPNDWYDPVMNKERWFERYLEKDTPLQYVNNIDKIFPEIVYMLEQLPYRQLSLACMFNQLIPVTCHTDWFSEDKDTDTEEISIENEPRRFNINLTKHGTTSFYVADSEFGERHYCNITKESPGYALCERYNWHGAEYIGENKILIVTSGLIDREKRDRLINKSLELYRKDLIMFG